LDGLLLVGLEGFGHVAEVKYLVIILSLEVNIIIVLANFLVCSATLVIQLDDTIDRVVVVPRKDADLVDREVVDLGHEDDVDSLLVVDIHRIFRLFIDFL